VATTKSFRHLVRQRAKADRKFAEALVRDSEKGSVGSSFDEFLKEVGLYKDVTARAKRRIAKRRATQRKRTAT
jgi:hypothetical protein